MLSGDGARRDEDGYFWITGRVDDVLNVSGHRMGTAEIESALVAHPHVAEAAIVGYPHDIKGQGIYAYVTLNLGQEPSDELRAELRKWVRPKLALLQPLIYYNGHRGCQKHGQAKLCAGFCARLPLMIFPILGIHQH